MYSQYPYGYRPGPYDAPQYDSAPYAAYYPQQAQQPAPPSTTRPAAASAPPQQRLSIRDPKTGAVVPIVTPQQVEKTVASYHKQRPKFGDLVGLDLEEVSDKCQAIYNTGSDAAEAQDPATFASTVLHPAAKQGLPHCQYYLGRCYETNQGGLPGNQELCKIWFNQASDQGILEASYKLGQCYEDGWGCPKSMSEAVKLYCMAADGGIQAAKLRLGFLHESGNGVPQDHEAAFKLYQQASDMVEGALCAARCHEHGNGTKVDLYKAEYLYQRAFNKGSREAAEHVSRIQSQIAMSDTGSVSSDQSGKGTRVSAPRASTQPDNKSRAQPNMGAAAVADQDGQRDGSPGSSRPNPQAKPFVPGQPTAFGLKAQAKEFKPQANNNGSASTAVPLRKGPKIAPPTGASGKGSLTAQAAVFQPRHAAAFAQPASQPAEQSSTATASAVVPSKQDKASSSAAASDTSADTQQQVKSGGASNTSPAKKQLGLQLSAQPAKEESRSDTALASPQKQQASDSVVPSTGNVDKEAAEAPSTEPVEDLDALHTEQMSAAWAALDAATGAEQPDQDAITEAIRHAQRFRELTECVKAAESFLRDLSGKTSTRSPGRQHTVTPSAVQPSLSSPGPDEASQADGEDTSTVFVDGNATQQDTLSTAGSESHPQALASSTSAQLHDELETATDDVSSHQEIDQQEAPHHVADQPATYAATSQPHTAPAQEQAAATKQYSLSPQAIASAKAAAVLALAQPASVSVESATATSIPSSSPRSQQEQHAPADCNSALPADETASVPTEARPLGGSMLDFLSFLLPAENPKKPTPSPTRRQPPGFEASNPQVQSGPDSGAELSRVEESVSESGLEDLHPHDQSSSGLNSAAQLPAAQSAPQQAPGHSRRAKPYQSTPSRGPAAPYQPPGIAAYHPPEDSGQESSEQWLQDSAYEPVEQQPPATHIPLQRQAPAYNPVQQQQRPALYVPAPLPPGATPSGHTSRPTSALAYNPPEAVDSSAISGPVSAETSVDDVLAKLLGLPQFLPPPSPEVPAASAEFEVEAEAEEQPAAELNSTATTGLQPQAEAQAAESRDHEAAADGKQKAASAHVEGSKPEDAHQQQNPALALSMEPSMSFLASNSDPDTDAQSSSSKADSLAADQSSAGKQRAVDADYSVSSHKAKSKSKKKAGAGSPVKTTAASAASPVAERPTQADATGAAPAEQRSQTSAFAAAQPASTAPTPAADGPASVTAAQEGDVQRTSAARSISSSSLGAAPAFLPPKPKPGGNRAKAARPATAEAASAAEQTQVMEAPSQQPLSAVHEPSAPAPQHQAAVSTQPLKPVPRAKQQQAQSNVRQQPRARSGAAAQPQKQSAAAQKPSPAGSQASLQAKLAANYPPAVASGSSNRKQQGQQEVDSDEWETVGHKIGPKLVPAKKQAQGKGRPAQRPQTEAQTAALDPPTSEPQSRAGEPQAENSALQQLQPVAQQPAATPRTIAPNSAWAKKLDLQAAGSGASTGAATSAAAASSSAATTPTLPPQRPQQQTQQDNASPSSSAAAPAIKVAPTERAQDQPAAASSSTATAPIQPPKKPPRKAEAEPTADASSSATAAASSSDAAASSNAAPPTSNPQQAQADPQQARPPSAGQKAKGKGKKKKGKQQGQATAQQPIADTEQAQPHDRSSDAQAGPSAEPSADQPNGAPAVPGTGSSAAQEIADRQSAALSTVMASGGRVTATNKDAWNEICTCPLSLDIMREPVVACDGITYERAPIAQWMQKNKTSPWTMEPFANLDLTPNILVSRLIHKFNLVESESPH